MVVVVGGMEAGDQDILGRDFRRDRPLYGAHYDVLPRSIAQRSQTVTKKMVRAERAADRTLDAFARRWAACGPPLR